MNQSDARNAAEQGSQSAMEATVMVPDARCFPQFVPIVAKRLKFHSNPAATNRFTVATVTANLEFMDNALVNNT